MNYFARGRKNVYVLCCISRFWKIFEICRRSRRSLELNFFKEYSFEVVFTLLLMMVFRRIG